MSVGNFHCTAVCTRIYSCFVLLIPPDDRREKSRYGEDNRGYGGSQGGGRGGYDMDGRGHMSGYR